MKSKIGNQKIPNYFFYPTLAILFAVIIFPLIFSLYMSFVKWRIAIKGSQPEFAAFLNYEKAIMDSRFHNSLSKTFYMLLLAIPIEFVFGLILALIFQKHFRGRRTVIALILFPLALSDAVAGLVWGLVLVPTYGPLDYILRLTGMWQLLGYSKPISFTISYPMESIVIADVWQWTPFFFLILLAGLSSLPTEPMEAAKIDGASSFMIFRHITLPMLKQIIGITIVFRIMDVFKSFGIPYIMTKGGPGYKSEVVSLNIFNQALQFLNIPYASALTWITIIIIIIILNAFMKIYRLKI